MDTHLVLLLGELYEQKAKIAVSHLPQAHGAPTQEVDGQHNWITRNLIQRFEVGLLQILERKLEISHLKTLSTPKARALLDALQNLLSFLDRRSNPSVVAPLVKQRSPSYRVSRYSNLEMLLNQMKQGPGPFNFTGYSDV